MRIFKLLEGDCLEVLCALPDESVQCVVTSPPYWGLRDYGIKGQLGLESNPEEYVKKLVEVFRGVRRVLRKDGTMWLVLGDTYTSGNRSTYKSGVSNNKGHPIQNDQARPATPLDLKPKDLVGIPWRVAFALQTNGWWLRSDIIWAKPNPMPESVTDRPTKAHEYVFLFSKSAKYYYDIDAIRDPHSGFFRARADEYDKYNAPGQSSHRCADAGRNKRTVWTIPTQAYPEAHFATFPEKLVEPCVLAGCPLGGTVLDIFTGSGTVGLVALRNKRKFIGIELNPEYVEMARKRITADAPLLNREK